ncbi:hypothetical protein BDZ91DRAFT_730788 [Kalaharituber pfeilii]|nr:hypothetical protein BDZ91DRAFT_730788 [Kalaharituber pfeilii]
MVGFSRRTKQYERFGEVACFWPIFFLLNFKRFFRFCFVFLAYTLVRNYLLAGPLKAAPIISKFLAFLRI